MKASSLDRPGPGTGRATARVTVLGVTTLLAGVTGLTGCSRAVEVTVPERGTDPACTRVGAQWPGRVGTLDRTDTSQQSPAVAAWGDPPIVARCGLPMPGPTTDECIVVDGVDWVARRVDDGMVFVTYGRDPAIQVIVPAAYAPEPLHLPAFGAAARQIPQGSHRCV